jgi:hypothetical protein
MAERRRPVSDAAKAAQARKRKQRERQMSPQERAKAEKDAARVRAYYDIPQVVKDAVVYVADREGLSASAVATLFLADALCRYREQSIVLDSPGIKRESPSPLYEFTVNGDVILSVLRGSRILER